MKVFELFEDTHLTEGSVYLRESLRLSSRIIHLLEDEGDFDWQPQPELRGAETVNTPSGAGEKAARAASAKVSADKINQLWQRLLRSKQQLASSDKQGPAYAKLQDNLKHMVTLAAKRGITLTPDPSKVLGLPLSGINLN